MTQCNTLYSVAFIAGPQSPFAGTECALWSRYGVPYKTPDYQAAQRAAKHYPGMRDQEATVVSYAFACKLTMEMVEVFTGRRTVRNGTRPVVDAERPEYWDVFYHPETGPVSTVK